MHISTFKGCSNYVKPNSDRGDLHLTIQQQATPFKDEGWRGPQHSTCFTLALQQVIIYTQKCG